MPIPSTGRARLTAAQWFCWLQRAMLHPVCNAARIPCTQMCCAHTGHRDAPGFSECTPARDGRSTAPPQADPGRREAHAPRPATNGCYTHPRCLAPTRRHHVRLAIGQMAMLQTHGSADPATRPPDGKENTARLLACSGSGGVQELTAGLSSLPDGHAPSHVNPHV
ncbi:hypothetical protein FHT08_000885 [Xanthomonas campestris]|nr:hypothetical protein [Xanthomonas sp. CFBP 8151]